MLDLSGERHGAGVSQPVDAEHWHRYLLALQLATGRDVLDIASGEGYGSALLATQAKFVTGVDASQDAVNHASSKYERANLKFVQGMLEQIPVSSASISLLTCFETIEHTVRHTEAMQEIRRVLTEDGILLMSTPDRLEYTDKRNYMNPFHVKELYKSEFEDLVRMNFNHVRFYTQRFYSASVIQGHEDHASFEKIYHVENGEILQSDSSCQPMYWIAVASMKELPDLRGSFFDITQAIDASIEMEKKRIYRSASYRIGNFIVRAASLFRKK